MTRSGLIPLAVTLLLCSAATPASAFKKCRTADGKLVFSDNPPAGCVVEGTFDNSAAAEDASEEPAAPGEAEASGGFDAQAIQARRRIERELAKASDELAALAREYASAPRLGGVYVDTKTGEGSFESGQNIDPRAAAGIRERENKVKERIRALQEEYATLTTKLAETHGGQLPPWWPAAPRCDGCS